MDAKSAAQEHFRSAQNGLIENALSAFGRRCPGHGLERIDLAMNRERVSGGAGQPGSR
jgi:hypothetical protein